MTLIDILLFFHLIISFLIGVCIFGRELVTWKGIGQMFRDYKIEYLVLLIIFAVKSGTELLEEPIEHLHGLDFTGIVYSLEGDLALRVQQTLISPLMTYSMILIYIGLFLTIYVFSFALFAYLGRRKVARDLLSLNVVLLFLAIPFYFFVVVYVTSYPRMFDPSATAVLPGMQALIYNQNPTLTQFFIEHDTLNNCFPSMHIGYPFGILLLLVREVRGFKGFKTFLAISLILTSISILYLGIHWVIDIFGGMAIGAVGVLLTERWSARLWRWIDNVTARIRAMFPDASQGDAER